MSQRYLPCSGIYPAGTYKENNKGIKADLQLSDEQQSNGFTVIEV